MRVCNELFTKPIRRTITSTATASTRILYHPQQQQRHQQQHVDRNLIDARTPRVMRMQTDAVRAHLCEIQDTECPVAYRNRMFDNEIVMMLNGMVCSASARCDVVLLVFVCECVCVCWDKLRLIRRTSEYCLIEHGDGSEVDISWLYYMFIEWVQINVEWLFILLLFVTRFRLDRFDVSQSWLTTLSKIKEICADIKYYSFSILDYVNIESYSGCLNYICELIYNLEDVNPFFNSWTSLNACKS